MCHLHKECEDGMLFITSMLNFYSMKKIILLSFLLASCGTMLKNPVSTIVPITYASPVVSEKGPLNTTPTIVRLDLKGRVLVEGLDAIYLENWDGSSPVMIHVIDSPIPMMALSSDGTELAYFQDNYAYVQNIETGRVKRLNQDIIGSIGGQLRWSPDGKKIALSCSIPDDPISSICLIDTDNSNIEILVDQKSLELVS